MNQDQLPVLFFGFANDKREHGEYLRSLTYERNQIEEALREIDGKLCQLAIHTDLSIKKLFEVFTDKRYRGRVVLFHFGGHANDFQLLLESEKGDRETARGDVLTKFLARQPGLQMVFLNGCSTQRHVQELIDQGVPAVIGTSSIIPDDGAAELASSFYSSLREGNSLENSWQNAVDHYEMKGNTGGKRGIVVPGSSEDGELELFHWKIQYRPGAYRVSGWNLPAAGKNPLFGLGLPDRYYAELPPAPYPGLHRFEEKHAPIFYGRGNEIRDLYDKINRKESLLLFFGQSGIGKSSLLAAGLLPRIQDHFEVRYVRRNTFKGLLPSVEEELSVTPAAPEQEEAAESFGQSREELLQLLAEQNKKVDFQRARELFDKMQEKPSGGAGPPLLKAWKRIEEAGRPLLLVVDQVEEAFTKPLEGTSPEDELNGFLEAMWELFFYPDNRPQGKLLLSYRKEYHEEVKKAVESQKLSFQEFFLEPIREAGIQEAIRGVTDHHISRAFYNFHVADGFPAFISRKLLSDYNALDESKGPVASVLQILLEKMWKAVNKKPSGQRYFDEALYEEVEGHEWLREYFENSLFHFPSHFVQSGFLFDLLINFVSPLGTAASLSFEELEALYSHRLSGLDEVLPILKEHSLLLEFSRDGQRIFRLIHDALAPVVRSAYNRSDYPGQQALRILDTVLKNNSKLSSEDVMLIMRSEQGRRRLNPEEQALFETARELYLKDFVSLHLSENDLSGALQELLNFFRKKNYRELLYEALLIYARFRNLMYERNHAIISFENILDGRRKIQQEILGLCRQFTTIDISVLKQRTIDAISEDELEEAIGLLSQLFADIGEEKYLNQLQLYGSQFAWINEESKKGTLSEKQMRVTRSQIRLEVFQMLKKAISITEALSSKGLPSGKLSHQRKKANRRVSLKDEAKAEELKQRVIDAIEREELGKAMSHLSDFFAGSGEEKYLDQLQLHRSQLAWLEKGRRKGTLPPDTVRANLALIRNELHQLLGRISPSDKPSSEVDVLETPAEIIHQVREIAIHVDQGNTSEGILLLSSLLDIFKPSLDGKTVAYIRAAKAKWEILPEPRKQQMATTAGNEVREAIWSACIALRSGGRSSFQLNEAIEKEGPEKAQDFLRGLLRDDKMEEAILYLIPALGPLKCPGLLPEVLIIEDRLNQVNEKERYGAINPDKARLMRSGIHYALLSIISNSQNDPAGESTPYPAPISQSLEDPVECLHMIFELIQRDELERALGIACRCFGQADGSDRSQHLNKLQDKIQSLANWERRTQSILSEHGLEVNRIRAALLGLLCSMEEFPLLNIPLKPEETRKRILEQTRQWLMGIGLEERENGFEKAMGLLLQEFNFSSPFLTQILTACSGRLAWINRKVKLGLIETDLENIEINKFVNTIISIIREFDFYLHFQDIFSGSETALGNKISYSPEFPVVKVLDLLPKAANWEELARILLYFRRSPGAGRHLNTINEIIQDILNMREQYILGVLDARQEAKWEVDLRRRILNLCFEVNETGTRQYLAPSKKKADKDILEKLLQVLLQENKLDAAFELILAYFSKTTPTKLAAAWLLKSRYYSLNRKNGNGVLLRKEYLAEMDSIMNELKEFCLAINTPPGV